MMKVIKNKPVRHLHAEFNIVTKRLDKLYSEYRLHDPFR